MNYDASNCTLCPRRCGADRRECAGACRAPDSAVVHSAFLHRFEEPVISGSDSARGSGAVFFSGCTMRCVYCQNAEISRRAEGESRTRYETGCGTQDAWYRTKASLRERTEKRKTVQERRRSGGQHPAVRDGAQHKTFRFSSPFSLQDFRIAALSRARLQAPTRFPS